MENHSDRVLKVDVEKFMQLNSIKTLDELLNLPDERYHKMQGFTWHLLKEILRLRKIQ
jgi:hypothetical protein